MRILPAILTAETDELIRQIDSISEFTDELDIDIMDGNFVREKSISIKDIPIKENLNFNFDLMVKKPKDYIEEILKAKMKKLSVNRVFVHVESDFKLEELVKSATGNFILGFSLAVPTAVENFLNIVNQMNSLAPGQIPPIQLYTVELGKQGNPYHPEVLGKIAKLRIAGYKGEIYIDGGIDPDIVMSLRQYDIAGVSVGSYISHSSDPMRAFGNLKDATWKKSLD